MPYLRQINNNTSNVHRCANRFLLHWYATCSNTCACDCESILNCKDYQYPHPAHQFVYLHLEWQLEFVCFENVPGRFLCFAPKVQEIAVQFFENNRARLIVAPSVPIDEV